MSPLTFILPKSAYPPPHHFAFAWQDTLRMKKGMEMRRPRYKLPVHSSLRSRRRHGVQMRRRSRLSVKGMSLCECQLVTEGASFLPPCSIYGRFVLSFFFCFFFATHFSSFIFNIRFMCGLLFVFGSVL